MPSDRERIEAAFQGLRAELGIRTAFPPPVLEAAERSAERADWAQDADREDLRTIPFVTIDPPGSEDLDQAVHIERSSAGYRVRYAIADVACFVERGGPVEEEAWLRGVTYYSPDRRDPLYPPSISQQAGSLLPTGDRPAVVFDLRLDADGRLAGTRVGRAVVRSRAKLTYHDALEHISGGGRKFAAEPFGESLLLLREVGESRIAVERERGGVSLPILDQHVERRAAHRLGYEVVYEEPSEAEAWNAQISLLAGHAAALRMGEGRMGLLRTMSAAGEQDVLALRVAALALGFEWPEGDSYSTFIHGVDRSHPSVDVLVWQARRLMRGASYRAFTGDLPTGADHAALAMPYAHCTAPLRRLADRYVLDLLVRLEGGAPVPESERETLAALPVAMEEAGKRAGRLERRVIDITEAWQLRKRVGDRFRALVLDARPAHFEAQLEELPVRARVSGDGAGTPLQPGDEVVLRLDGVALEEGTAEFALVAAPGADPALG